ncbi:MAG: hypothetical protein GYB65_15775 [Chloroflexi bacterium]|nr:hypothetical protein [Chloroflexota bacterium]
MPQRKTSVFDDDTRSTRELFDAALADPESDESGQVVAVLQSRATREVFGAAAALCASADHHERQIGVRILGGVGFCGPAFADESLAILIERLDDPVEDVIAAACAALGHRREKRAIPHLLRFKGHPSENVRFSVAFALGGFDDDTALAALIDLSRDADEDVRDWATFGLGSMSEADTPELRAALVARLHEDSPEIRGEALIGLARRDDPRVIEPLMEALRDEFYGDWPVEAAEILGDPRFYSLLVGLRARVAGEVAERFVDGINRAIAACAPKGD